MIDIPKILYEICGDEAVLDPDCELIESGLLDSLALIELVSRLEDEGVTLHLTRIDRSLLKTPRSIAELVNKTNR
ncbi:MAG: D-alanine--poly(phosphoribitol) ligase subunit 2 [Clostridia bacterium]|nr:D-alanine--poly(phosphoribitol) ligase subunit 2 [Clostridia bacterium]